MTSPARQRVGHTSNFASSKPHKTPLLKPSTQCCKHTVTQTNTSIPPRGQAPALLYILFLLAELSNQPYPQPTHNTHHLVTDPIGRSGQPSSQDDALLLPGKFPHLPSLPSFLLFLYNTPPPQHHPSRTYPCRVQQAIMSLIYAPVRTECHWKERNILLTVNEIGLRTSRVRDAALLFPHRAHALQGEAWPL